MTPPVNATRCPACGARVILCGDDHGAIVLVDLEPVAGGELVLRRALNSAPLAMPATTYDLGARYRGHRCLRPTRVEP